MKKFYILNEEQKDLYFNIIKTLPDDVYNIDDKDVEDLNSAINKGEPLTQNLLMRLRCASVFARLLKEIKGWQNNEEYVSRNLMPADLKEKELLEFVEKCINKKI